MLDGYGYVAPKTGKGGAAGKGKTSGGSVNAALGLAMGPIIYNGTLAVYENAGVAQASTLPLNWYDGFDGQSPDPTFASNSPNQPTPNYSGIFYVTGTPFQLQGGVLPNFSAELHGYRSGTAGNNGAVVGYDANPALIVTDMLYDSRVGIHFPGPPSDFSIWANFCQAAVLGFSLLCDKQQPLSSWIEELLLLTTSAGFWSSGRFVILPYSIGQLDNNGAAYYPNLTPVANLTDDDFLSFSSGSSGRRSPNEKDPVLIMRSDVSKLTNWMTIEILERDYRYDSVICPPQFDQGSIDLYGVRTESSIQAHEVCTQVVGEAVVGYLLQRKHRLRNTFKFRVGWRYMLLEPMDIVSLTDTVSGLQQYPVRIIEIEEDEEGGLTMTAEELV